MTMLFCTFLVLLVPPSLAQRDARASFLSPEDKLVDTVSPNSYGHPAWLSKCTRIFLDIGSNRGVQVRKLFEPEKYPGATLIKQFDQSFGPVFMRQATGLNGRGSGLCALGMEPNPEHLTRLKKIEKAYRKKGWHVHFYPFAALNAEGSMGFNKTGVRGNAEDGTVAGGHLGFSKEEMEAKGNTDDYLVRTVNLADFISSLPKGTVKIMKMDAEGAEYDSLATMIRAGQLCSGIVGKAFIEAHAWGSVTEWEQDNGLGVLAEGVHPRSFRAIKDRLNTVKSSGRCDKGVTAVSEFDDESYLHDVDDSYAS